MIFRGRHTDLVPSDDVADDPREKQCKQMQVRHKGTTLHRISRVNGTNRIPHRKET